MRLPRLLLVSGRLALAATLICVTGAVAATSAQAAPVPDAALPTIKIAMPDRVVANDGETKFVGIEVTNTGEVDLQGVVLEFGTPGTPIDPAVGFKPPERCTGTSCAVGEMTAGRRLAFNFSVAPTVALPAAGASFAVTVRDTGNTWRQSTTFTVLRVTHGIDLEARRMADIALAPGKSATLPIVVRNSGDISASGVALGLIGTSYISYPEKYSNCVTEDELPGIICVFDRPLGPGEVFTIAPSTPLTVQVDPIAPGPADYRLGLAVYGLDDKSQGAKLAAAQATAAQSAAKEPGDRAELVPVKQADAGLGSSEPTEWDALTEFVVKVSLNPADTVAIGDDFEGAIGDTRTVKVGFRNDGPAVVLGPNGEWKLAAKVRIPSGLALTKVDKGCVPNGDGDPSWDHPGQVSGHDYLCVATAPLGVHAEKLFSFTAKIEDGKNEDEGTITVDGGVQDNKTSNNVAKIEVKVPTTGGGSGGGSGGGLPITGAPAGGIAGTGLFLVIGGALLLFLTRRRAVPLGR